MEEMDLHKTNYTIDIIDLDKKNNKIMWIQNLHLSDLK